MKTIFRKILVPYDFSRQATEALEVAVGLAAQHRGTLTVLHAMPHYRPLHGPAWVPPPALIDKTHREIDSVVTRVLKRRRVKVKNVVLFGEPYLCILRAAERADSIVMSTTGRTGLPHLLMGSVAEKIVRLSPIPVLTVRAAAKRPARRARTTS